MVLLIASVAGAQKSAIPASAERSFHQGLAMERDGDVDEAITEYREAIKDYPDYADAHYNLALAFERLRRPRKALTHWRAYVKMDPVGAWSNYARGQIQKIVAAEKLRIVWRRPGIGIPQK
jgi:tetratricopeptide (TPR) repeat protein